MRQYFTMSSNQIKKHWPECPFTGGYVEVDAPDSYEAREMMVAVFGKAWAFQYDYLDDVHPSDRNKLAIVKQD